MEWDNVFGRKLNSLQRSGRQQGRDFKDSVAVFRRLVDCYPQAFYSAGIDPSKLEIALSNTTVDGGISGQCGGQCGDAARKQQMAVENIILDAVKKRPRDKRDRI